MEKDNSHPDFAGNIIKSIKLAKLNAAQQGLLITEWILREYSTYELFDMTPTDIINVIKEGLNNLMAEDLPSTFSQVSQAFPSIEENRMYHFVVALAYFLYINDEFVYDYKTRDVLLSKEEDFGLSVSQVRAALKSWKKKFGDPSIPIKAITSH